MYGKVKQFSIIKVKYQNGHAWYKTKRGRSIDSVVSYFSKRYDYKYLQIYNFSRKTQQVGQKTFYHSKNGSTGNS